MHKKKAYDLIFGDEEGTRLRYDFLLPHLEGNSVLEVGCGSGDLLTLLSTDYTVTGVDKDPQMINNAIDKYPHLRTHFLSKDIMEYEEETYDSLICIGDSLNYNMNKESLYKFLDKLMDLSNVLILDMHHLYRLEEFKEGYEEEGRIDTLDYGYQIQVEEDFLLHIVNYFDGSFDVVQQWVFSSKIVVEYLRNNNYEVDIFTDFEKGTKEIGEKVMLVAKRRRV